MQRILFAVLISLLLIAPVAAQSDDPYEQLLKELWCPLCNGIRLDVCEQQVCEQMRDLIRQELDAGKTPEEIKAEFVDLYGPVVLGEPPREGFNLLAWVIPVILVVAGLAAAVVLTRRWSAQTAEDEPMAGAVAARAPDIEIDEEDEYLARVEREVNEL
ncbi:MAG: hypothetical protein GXP42_11340 [Chloroflexi bacterium]|nr:hypothetical protein [Chloroflexota bacterium]